MFDIHQPVVDESGEFDAERVNDYVEGLLEDFALAPEGKAHLQDEGFPCWADMFLRYYFDYVGHSVAALSPGHVREVVFTLFPRKVSADPETAPEIIEELRVFWTYLGRQFGLSQAPKIVALLNDDAVLRLRAELANPRSFGMAKSFFMLGEQAGFDMSTQEGMDAFTAVYNSQLTGGDAGFISYMPLRDSSKSRKDQRKKKKQQRQARRRNRR